MIDRMQRVEALIQEEVSRLIEADAETLGMVSILAVQVQRDLSAATVFIQPVLASDPQALLRELHSKNHAYRTTLLKRLHLRRIPELHFELDRRGEEIGRIESLLDQIGEEEQQS